MRVNCTYKLWHPVSYQELWLHDSEEKVVSFLVVILPGQVDRLESIIVLGGDVHPSLHQAGQRADLLGVQNEALYFAMECYGMHMRNG